MMTLADIRKVLYPSMPVGVWMEIGRLYDVIERSGELGDEDYQPSTPGGDEPKWRRNVRNVLQHDKDKAFLDWNPNSAKYRLNYSMTETNPGEFFQHWWVNQNQTYQFEVPDGYMWSPKTNSNGARNQFYENMTETNPGDVIFSFKDTYIKAIGIVTGPAESRIKPLDFNSVENPWDEEGWFVPVEFTELEKPIRPKDHMDLIGPTLPEKYSPLQHNGNGLQSVYLANVPTNMAHVLSALLDGQVEAILETEIGSVSSYRRADETVATETREPFAVDQDAVDRGLRAHRTLQNAVADAARVAGFAPLSPSAGSPNFDVAWQDSDTFVVVEVKSLNEANEVSQMRLGVGQILDYAEHYQARNLKVRAVLAVERQPDQHWSKLCADHRIVLVWPSVLERMLQ